MTDDPFTWACGKCGSGAIYRDGDAIACPVCGNRYYRVVIVEGKAKEPVGLAPVKQYRAERPRLAIDDPHFMLERTENIITGAERFRIGKGDFMSARGICEECGKERAIIAKKRCWTCYQKGRKEDARVPATPAVPDIPPVVHLLKQGINIPPEAREIPVTLRLTLEINVRVLGVATA